MEKEVQELIDIIKNEFGVDIRKKSRKQTFVDGRFVFSKILADRGYVLSDLGRAIGRHHSSIIHQRDSANDLIETNEIFALKFTRCKRKFLEGKVDIVHSHDRDELLNQIETLILEKNDLLKKMEKYKRLKNIIEFIDSRTPSGKESFMLRKINLMINGLTDYGQELEQ